MTHRPVHSPTHRPVHNPVPRYARTGCTLVAPRLWDKEGVGGAKLNNDEKARVLRLR